MDCKRVCLGEAEEEVEVAEDDDIGVDEDDLVIVGELPEAELAVVVLVVSAILGSWISDPGDDSDLPTRIRQGLAFGNGDRFIYEEDKVAFGYGLKEALCQCNCPTNIGFRRMQNCGVGFAFHSGSACPAFPNLQQVVHFVNS